MCAKELNQEERAGKIANLALQEDLGRVTQRSTELKEDEAGLVINAPPLDDPSTLSKRQDCRKIRW